MNSKKDQCETCLLADTDQAQQSLTIRLSHGKRIYGFMHISLVAELEISAGEQSLLREMAGDLGFALYAIEAGKRLKENEKKYRQIFNNANDAIYMHTITPEGMPGKFLEVNAIACRMLGYKRAEFLSMSPLDIDAESRIEDARESMTRILEEDKCVFEMVHIAKDGTEIPVEISSHLFELNSRKLVLSVVRDISERQRAEEELRNSTRIWNNTFDAISDIVAVISTSHEIININSAGCRALGLHNPDKPEPKRYCY